MTPPSAGALKLRPSHAPFLSTPQLDGQPRKLPSQGERCLVELDFAVEAGQATWTVRGPLSPPRRVVSPLADERFRWLVASLREWANRPVPIGRCDPLRIASFAEDRSRRVSARLTRALLAEEDQHAVALAMALNGQAELALRVRSEEGDAGAEALALPWELLAPERPGRFPVRDGRLTILRESLADGTPLPDLRDGLAQVVGYLGPANAELYGRLKQRFHGVLAAGGTLPQAAGATRALLSEPRGEKGARHHFPFGWSQLAIYRGRSCQRDRSSQDATDRLN